MGWKIVGRLIRDSEPRLSSDSVNNYELRLRA